MYAEKEPLLTKSTSTVEVIIFGVVLVDHFSTILSQVQIYFHIQRQGMYIMYNIDLQKPKC